MKCKSLLLIGVVIGCLYSCKKETHAPSNSTLILGKWYAAKQVSVLYNNGTQIKATNKTNFTNDDFVEYYNDGSGYYSKSTTQGPSLSEFTYSLSGTTITQYMSAVNAGTPETITSISTGSLSIHIVSLVPDPNDPTVTDTEIDDFSYTK